MGKGSLIPRTLQTLKASYGFNPGMLSVVTLLVMVFVMGLVKIYSPDLGFHLKSAAWILENKQFIYTDSFSYGSDGRAYYDLQWLFQLLVFSLYQLGQPALVIVNALLISFSIAFTWFRFSKDLSMLPKNSTASVFAVIAMVFVLPLSFEIRPHVLSWIYLNLVLLVLESYKRGRNKSLNFLPLIMLFWVNSHSLSILGLVTIGIYNAGLFFENKKADKKLLLFSGLALATFLINPYFFDGLLFPFKQFGIISGTGLGKAYISEFQSPFAASELKILGTYFFTNPVLLLQYVSALLVAICCLFAFLKKKYTDTLLLAAYLYLFNLGLKNYGYYLMVCLPLVARYVMDWLQQRVAAKHEKKTIAFQREKNKKATTVTSSFHTKAYSRLAIITVCVNLLISVTCINNGYTILLQVQDRFGLTEDKDQLPVEAADFLVKNKITGKMLNHFNFGGYLMAHANAKVFIDGRFELINNVFFSDYYSSVTEQNGIKKLLDTFNPDIVIFPYAGSDGTVWWNYFLAYKNATGYRPVYFDGLSVIYLRSSAFPQIPELTAQSVLKDLDVNDIKKLDALIRMPDKPRGVKAWLQSTCKKQVLPVDDIKKSIFCFSNGFEQAALVYCVRSMERSTVRTDDAIYTNLALYYAQRKMYNEAQLCQSKLKRK